MSWVDFVILFFALGCFFQGLKKGFIMQALELLSAVFSFLLAVRWAKTVGHWLGNLLPLEAILAEKIFTVTPEQIFHGKIIPEELAVFPEGAVETWMSTTLWTLLSFILIFFLSFMFIRAICRVFKIVNLLPLVGPLNRLGGGLLALIKFLFLLFIIIGLVSFWSFDFLSDLLRASAFVGIAEHFLAGFYALVVDYLLSGLCIDLT